MKILDKNGEEIRIRNIVRFKSWREYSSKPRIVEGRVIKIVSDNSYDWETGSKVISTRIHIHAKEDDKEWNAVVKNFQNVEVLKLSCFNNEN